MNLAGTGLLYLRLSPSCSLGVALSWDPPSSARVVTTVRARGSGLVAAVLQPRSRRERFRLVVTPATSSPYDVLVALEGKP